MDSKQFLKAVNGEYDIETLELMKSVIGKRIDHLNHLINVANPRKVVHGFRRDQIEGLVKESLRDWFKKEDWVRITTSGDIAGPCGTSKNTKNPDRCLPRAKAHSLTKAERAATARKKKAAGTKGAQVVSNTKKAKVTKEDLRNLVVGLIHEMQNESTLTEKDDRCTRIAKRKYDTWPSAYASGAVVRCRRGEIWKDE